MSSNLNTFRSNTNKEKFAFSGNGQNTILSVNDLTQATKIVKVTGEAITLTGASGATGKIKFGYFPVFDSIGGSIGYFNSATDNDSSVVVNALALDGNQVRIDEYMTDTEIYASLSKGDYAINYIKGILYFKKNTADTAGTIDYIYSTQEITATINPGDIQIGAVEVKDATTDNRAIIDASGNLSVALKVDSVGLATETTLATLEGKDFATETTLATLEGKDFATETTLATLEGKDFATETTLATLEGKDFATETTLATLEGKDFATQTTLATLASKDFATETTLTTLAGKDFATETTLATLASKDFATETTLTTLAGKDFATSTIQTNKTQMTNITDGTNELLIDASGNAKINLTTDSVGLAKASTQTDKTQMTRVTNGTKELEIDANGNANINLITDSVGLATQATLGAINTSIDQVIDDGTNSVKIKELSPVWSRYTDAESLVSAQALTNTYANFGAVIDMRGYNVLQVWLIADVNDSENVKMKSLGKTASDGTDLYDLDDYPEETLWTTGASDFKKSYTFKLNNSIPYVQLQAYAGTVGATAGTLTLKITKSYIE